MAKQLILLRHAKSVSQFTSSDFNRTLNEKGRKDAPEVAKAFKLLGIQPDIILCSTAIRTKETLSLFNLDAPVQYLDNLYHASASEMFDIILENKNYQTIMVVGHNFGITNLANQLSTTGAAEMNTCGLYIIEFPDGIELHQGKILNYLSPKTI
jgi:phosphohistidine phosphatase